MKKTLKVGEYKHNRRPVDVVWCFGHKNQPRDSKGRFIHLGTIPEHIDNYEKHNKEGKCQHIALAEIKTISLKGLPKTVPVPWNYSKFCIGIKELGTNIETKNHRGSVTIEGESCSSGVLELGSPDPSRTWY